MRRVWSTARGSCLVVRYSGTGGQLPLMVASCRSHPFPAGFIGGYGTGGLALGVDVGWDRRWRRSITWLLHYILKRRHTVMRTSILIITFSFTQSRVVHIHFYLTETNEFVISHVRYVLGYVSTNNPLFHQSQSAHLFSALHPWKYCGEFNRPLLRMSRRAEVRLTSQHCDAARSMMHTCALIL